jgi:hypothetical protein
MASDRMGALAQIRVSRRIVQSRRALAFRCDSAPRIACARVWEGEGEGVSQESA